jgi:hypothetical protein
MKFALADVNNNISHAVSKNTICKFFHATLKIAYESQISLARSFLESVELNQVLYVVFEFCENSGRFFEKLRGKLVR